MSSDSSFCILPNNAFTTYPWINKINETTTSTYLHPNSELRRSKRSILGGSKKRAQFLEFSSLVKNEEVLDLTSGNDSQESTIEGQKSKVPNIQIIESVVGEEKDGTRSQTTKIDNTNSPLRAQKHRVETFDMENPTTNFPILPNNPNFFCFFGYLHITTVAKFLSLFYVMFYGFLCYLSYKSNHAPSFLIAVLVAFSVGGSTLYATFNWAKLCLIPFFLLQAMLCIYGLICILLLTLATFTPTNSYLFQEFNFSFDGVLRMSTHIWIFITLMIFVILEILLLYSALLFWYNYQFIAEVDRFLKMIRKQSSPLNHSKDDQFGANGTHFVQTTSNF